MAQKLTVERNVPRDTGSTAGSKFNLLFRNEIQIGSDQVVTLKTDGDATRVELAVIFPEGKKKLFQSKIRSGRCDIRFSSRSTGMGKGSIIAFNRQEIVFIRDFTFTVRKPSGSPSSADDASTRRRSSAPQRREIKLPDNFRKEIIKSWPNSSAYSQALQNLSFSVSDRYSDIRSGDLVRNQNVKFTSYIFGSGNFGTVFKINSASRDYALKCFTRASPDLAERYYFISEYLSGISLPFLVGFKYLSSAVRMISKPTSYYPILKMDWMDGVSLNTFVSSRIRDGKALRSLADTFLDASIALHANGIAHGDVSSDNMIINSSGRLIFIDYDGMFVPPLSGRIAPERGHEHFQHPLRGDHYGTNLDNFSVLVVYVSLYALSRNPDLWKYNGDDGDKLILDVRDFMEPSKSPIIEEMKKVGGKTKKLAELLVQACGKDPLWDGTDPDKIKSLA